MPGGTSGNGPGIRSSAAAATPGTAIGYGQASTIFSSFPTTFAGQSITSGTEVLARYTLRGDANLDRLVNVADFNILAANYNGANTQFTQGNFNFDATVNAGDFDALATEYGMQTAGDLEARRRGPLSGVAVPSPRSNLFSAEAIRDNQGASTLLG